MYNAFLSMIHRYMYLQNVTCMNSYQLITYIKTDDNRMKGGRSGVKKGLLVSIKKKRHARSIEDANDINVIVCDTILVYMIR